MHEETGRRKNLGKGSGKAHLAMFVAHPFFQAEGYVSTTVLHSLLLLLLLL